MSLSFSSTFPNPTSPNWLVKNDGLNRGIHPGRFDSCGFRRVDLERIADRARTRHTERIGAVTRQQPSTIGSDRKSESVEAPA